MNPNKRLLSLDVLRGITVAGMILVNNTGKCGYNFAAFAHAKWDGFSPADLVFPMFMFLMGISTYISLCKYDFQCRPAITKIIKRSLLLIFIGLVMEWFITSIDSGNYFDLSQLRLMGVMQRLGICYGITALLAVAIPHKRFMPLAIILLIVYFIFQLFGNGFEKSTWNISLYNAYNAMNPTFVYRSTSKNDPNKPIIKKYTILPLIPSFTYTYKF